MSAPQGVLEGQSITRPPYFNGQHYSWWKNRMENYIQAEDFQLWAIIENGPQVPMETTSSGSKIPKKVKDFDSEDYRIMEKNAKAKKLLYFVLGPDEYNRISKCECSRHMESS